MVGAQTGWDLVGPRPDSTPRPQTLHGIAASSRRCCSCPGHRVTSPGQWREGCWRSQTSAASRPNEPGNSAGDQREVFFNNSVTTRYVTLLIKKEIKTEIMEIIVRLTWRCCCPLLGWMRASPEIRTLSWSEGQKARSWSSSTDTIPEQTKQVGKGKYISEIMTSNLSSPSQLTVIWKGGNLLTFMWCLLHLIWVCCQEQVYLILQ